MKYELTIETAAGPKTLKSDNPISEETIKTFKEMYSGSKGADPTKGSKGIISSLLDNVKDIGSEAKKVISEGKAVHEHNKKNASNGVDPFGLFHRNTGGPETPTQNALVSNVLRGASLGTSRFIEKNSGKDTDAYANLHPLTSGIADVLGTVLTGAPGAKQIAKVSSRFIPKTGLKQVSKIMLGTGAYGGERQLVNSLGTDDPDTIKNTAKAAALSAALGGLSHTLSRAVPAIVNRVNPVAASKNAGIYGNKLKATNAAKTGQIPADVRKRIVDYNEKMGDIKDPNVLKLLSRIGKNPESRADYLALSRKPKGVNGGSYTKEMKATFGRVKNTIAEPGAAKRVQVPFSLMGAAKTTTKTGAKGYKKLIEGAYSDRDLVKLFDADSVKFANLTGQKMNIKRQDEVGKILAKLLSNYGREEV
jgi:hypothetical protein